MASRWAQRRKERNAQRRRVRMTGGGLEGRHREGQREWCGGFDEGAERAGRMTEEERKDGMKEKMEGRMKWRRIGMKTWRTGSKAWRRA
jgi:hypothetical protein